jgi:hypothetical protein
LTNGADADARVVARLAAGAALAAADVGTATLRERRI